MENDRAKEGKLAGHEGERHDDVPVSQGKTESGPKQPASDLSGPAPEAHDAPAQVDKKTADGAMSDGVDPALVEEINEQTLLDEMADPMANMPGYREHSNALDAQLADQKEFVEGEELVSYPEDPMTDEEFATPNMIEEIMD
jgi:hypothetical protein